MGGGPIGTVDSALNLTPQFGTGEVIRNSFLGRCWGEAEKGGPGFPFTPGASFNMHISVTEQAFKVGIQR